MKKKSVASKKTSKAGPRAAAKKKLSKSAKPSLKKLAQGIWPAERDILFRPDRMKYVRKLIHPEGCVFCHAASRAPAFESLCLLQTEHSMLVLNKYPYNSGHLLVLPKRHCGNLLDLSLSEYQDLQMLVRKAFQLVEKVYQPGGINMGLNHGKVSGAGIPEHIHYHLVPRWAGDLNFFPLIAETKVVIESLDQTYEKLSKALSSMKSSAFGGANSCWEGT